MKPLFALLLLTLPLFAGKNKTLLSKPYVRDSTTTITRFTVDQIVLNSDSTLTLIANGGDVTVRIYQDSLPVRVRQGLQRINADLKALLER